ncbi:MAG: hypothetical protein HY461_02865 [Parcubacteria group bacterium]|nr:hypothetical protein [Parcubacteria group bacterium]
MAVLKREQTAYNDQIELLAIEVHNIHLELTSVRTDLGNEISQLRQELNSKIDALDKKFDRKFDGVDKKLNLLLNALNISLT